MFHSSVDNYPTQGSLSHRLSLTVIDINGNFGLGSVILKNFPIISDTLNTGKITACRHANGRDWWVICHRANSNKYYKLLVTPYGLPSVNSQNIGSYRYWDAGQIKFSPDGSKLAYYHYHNGLDIMDFDRCTGIFSNSVTDTTLPYIQGNVGCEFSPNSQFLYVANILKVYQYDVYASNILATRTEVAVWDTFAQPGVQFLYAYLCIPQLAPDGKIYITTGNGTTYMGRINSPDSAGVACDVAQHSVLLSTYYFNTIPNHPNYFLSNIPGSSCDTIINLGINESEEIKIKVWPNPVIDFCTFSFPSQSNMGKLEISDCMGKVVFVEDIAAWSQFKQVDISMLKQGMYLCKISWNKYLANIKYVKE